MTGPQAATELYLPYLLEGPTGALLDLFASEPSIDDPLVGRVAGREAFNAFAPRAQAWLRARHARFEHLRTTQTDPRTVVEWIAHLRLGAQSVPLPVAVVGDHPARAKLEQIRIYHSMWPLIGGHQVRRAMLPARHDLVLSDVIARYQHALAEGDVGAIVSTFEPDGYFREPAGGEYVYRGTAKLRQFMASLLGSGGITLEHCTVADDRVACAIEFNAVKFGPHPLIPQAGVAVYERGPSGLLHAARIYDDVNVEAYAGQGAGSDGGG